MTAAGLQVDGVDDLPRLIRAVARRLGAVDDDLIQEALIAAWRAQDTWRPDGGMSRQRWTLQAARYAVADEWRRRSGRPPRDGRPDRRPRFTDIHQWEDSDDDGDVWPVPEPLIDHRHPDVVCEHADVARLLWVLTPRQATVVWLRHWQQWTLAEIGGHFGFTESWACHQHRQALAVLRGVAGEVW